MNFPKEIINIILEYDGKFLYRKGVFVVIIPKNDVRYFILEPVIQKKVKACQNCWFDDFVYYFQIKNDSLNIFYQYDVIEKLLEIQFEFREHIVFYCIYTDNPKKDCVFCFPYRT